MSRAGGDVGRGEETVGQTPGAKGSPTQVLVTPQQP